MTTHDNRLIVIRAWRDSGRVIIRVLTSTGPKAPATEAVFTDINSASARLVEVLLELCEPSPESTRQTSDGAHTKR